MASSFLDNRSVLYTPTIETKEKSGYSHHADFAIPKKEKDIFLNVQKQDKQ